MVKTACPPTGLAALVEVVEYCATSRPEFCLTGNRKMSSRSKGCRFILTLVIGLSAGLSSTQPARAEKHLDADVCAVAGRWLEPSTGKVLDASHLLSRLSKKAVVLLGESHMVNEHHLWQAQTLSGLLAYKRNLAVGFEMFPRHTQETLDEWAKGTLSESSFLKKVGWNKVWVYDSDFYMPLFNIVRQNRLSMIAINVDRKLISRVGSEGWKAVPLAERKGLTDPRPASTAYRQTLAEIYELKRQHGSSTVEQPDTDEVPKEEESEAKTSLSEVMESEGFARFVDAQLTWDRAMAEALWKVRKNNPDTLITGVLGRGHIEHRYGVPHQLEDLGIRDVAVLLPVEVGEACENTPAEIADAIFLVDKEVEPEHTSEKPKLGVHIEAADNGIRLISVLDGSIAQTAALAAGDIIVKAAGITMKSNTDLIEVIQRQAPGTWLPLDIQRGDQKLEIIAKFPPRAETSP